MPLFDVDLGEGRRFHATERIAGDAPLYGNFQSTEEGQQQLVNWVLERFFEAVRAKTAENERLRRNEWYYNGFHWSDPEANRRNEVRNFVFATVETAQAILTEIRPRPEVVLRRQYGNAMVADDYQERAEWVMDVSGWDYNCSLGDREKLKHGYAVYLLNCRRDGVCVNHPYSVYDFYRDPTATNDDEMEYYFLARPLATDYLAQIYPPSRYPHLWKKGVDELGRETHEFEVQPDNVMSPGYRAIQYPFELDGTSSPGSIPFEPDNIFGYVGRLESGDPNPPTTATTGLVRTGDMETRRHGRTTFHVQMFVRDRTFVRVNYMGEVSEETGGELPLPDGSTMPEFARTKFPGTYRKWEPACESGWRVITVTLDRKFISSVPIDPCYLGRNVVIDRDHPQVGRWECPGEADHVIPINRSLNRRLTNIKNAHAFETDPVLVLDTGAGNDIQGRGVSSGEVIRKKPGTEVRWLDPPKGTAAQFEMVSLDLSHMDFVSGQHDVTTGRRPEGIEAASAIRNLQEAAQTRIRGKEVPGFHAKAVMLKKMMHATGCKLDPGIMFLAQNGNMKRLDPKSLTHEFDIRFAPGSGTAVGRAASEEKNLGLFQAGLLDPQTALERLNVRGIPMILMRRQAMLQSAATADEGGSQDEPTQEE